MLVTSISNKFVLYIACAIFFTAIQSDISATQSNLPPQFLYLLNEAVPIEDAESALILSGYDVSRDDLKPMGEKGSGGYHAIIGPVRYLFQGAIKSGDKIFGQFVKTHVHSLDEESYVAFGGAHVWTWSKDNVEHYQFYQQGDTMLIPAGTPHCVVAASSIGQEGIEQVGTLMVRSSVSNPQQFLPNLPIPAVLQEAINQLETSSK